METMAGVVVVNDGSMENFECAVDLCCWNGWAIDMSFLAEINATRSVVVFFFFFFHNNVVLFREGILVSVQCNVLGDIHVVCT